MLQQVLDLIQSGFRPMLARVRPILIYLGLFLLWLEAIRLIINWFLDRSDWRYDLFMYVVRGSIIMALLFTTYGTIFNVIYQTGVQIGLKAGGNVLSEANFMDPGQYIHLGFQAGEPLWEKIRLGTIISSEPTGIPYFFAWLAVIAAYICLAFSVFMAQVEISLGLIATAIMLPFACWAPTHWMARGTLAYPINKAFRFCLLALLASVLFPIIKNELSLAPTAPRTLWRILTTMPDKPTDSLSQACVLILATWTMAILYMKTSTIASSILSGRPALTGSMAMHQAMGGAVAAATVGTGVVAGGLIAAGGAGGVIGAPAVVGATDTVTNAAMGRGLARAGQGISAGLVLGARNILHE